MMECSHDNIVITKKYFKSDNPVIAARFHVCRQCTACGEQVGSNLPVSTVEGISNVPAFDQGLRQQGYKRRQEEWQRQQQKRNEEWWEGYDTYLNSPQWRFKRRMVLSRDKSMCQARLNGCKSEAKEVHHLSYKNLGDEPLWELVSVCRNCHQKITERSRERAA